MDDRGEGRLTNATLDQRNKGSIHVAGLRQLNLRIIFFNSKLTDDDFKFGFIAH